MTSPTDTISIERIRITTCIGVPPEERAIPQNLEVSLTFPITTVSKAAHTDDLTHSIDYFEIYQKVHTIAAERPRKLIETLAEDLATSLKEKFTLPSIHITIHKFILPHTRSVSISIHR